MKNYRWVIFLIFLFNFFTFSVNAQSPYVLPYPSFMPGSMFYKINIIKDEILRHWYFGSFGQFKYNLKQSDKYLVEAKTLFEYKQYLLGSEALKKSDNFFTQTTINLNTARGEGKDIKGNFLILKNAGSKHIEVLSKLGNEVPESFTWSPEKKKPTILQLKKDIDNSIEIRKKHQ